VPPVAVRLINLVPQVIVEVPVLFVIPGIGNVFTVIKPDGLLLTRELQLGENTLT
jgi:hypothetical protein